MRITQVRSLVLAALLGVTLPAVALAQTDVPADQQQNFGPRKKAGAATGAPPKGEVIATHGAWSVTCGDVPDGADGKTVRQCGMSQVTKSEKDERVGLSLVIAKSKQGEKTLTMMRVMAPIGVYLPTGVALEIDGAAVGRVPFTRCRPQLCEALAEASPPTLDKMKQGTAANFIIYEGPGLGIPMKISLEGFSAALSELEKQ